MINFTCNMHIFSVIESLICKPPRKLFQNFSSISASLCFTALMCSWPGSGFTNRHPSRMGSKARWTAEVESRRRCCCKDYALEWRNFVTNHQEQRTNENSWRRHFRLFQTHQSHMPTVPAVTQQVSLSFHSPPKNHNGGHSRKLPF